MGLTVVTGASRGIGEQLCRQLAARGEAVLAVCRSENSALAELGIEVLTGVDVCDPAGIERVVAVIGERFVSVLIHNAGILNRDHLDRLDPASIRRQIEVNAIAPLLLTEALLPRLGHGSKVAILTSRMGSIGDNTSGSMYGYRMSKAAVNMAGKSLAIDLAPRGVAVVLLHPGYVATDMTGGHGNISPAQSAAGLIVRIDTLDAENTGRFLHAEGQELPW